MSAYEVADELDERVVVAESMGPRAVEGHHQECPRRPPPRIVGGSARDQTVPALQGREVYVVKLDRVGIIVVRHYSLKMNVEHSSIVSSSRCSGPQLKVRPGVFEIVLGARWGISRKGDELLW
ncbi:hypothetical protein GOBAR_AA32916 [Gossypium barbadense]|uniref:Uncharacterized protein n=1 Tax=Gossypium barbadense TaxID=3634 RepID=A0A2P5W9I4_GOSBA|nr:hypothetical protein GOBAR_AA32916 [Gossypium barbadense]